MLRLEGNSLTTSFNARDPSFVELATRQGGPNMLSLRGTHYADDGAIRLPGPQVNATAFNDLHPDVLSYIFPTEATGEYPDGNTRPHMCKQYAVSKNLTIGSLGVTQDLLIICNLLSDRNEFARVFTRLTENLDIPSPWYYLTSLSIAGDLTQYAQARTVSGALAVFSDTISTTNVTLSGRATAITSSAVPADCSYDRLSSYKLADYMVVTNERLSDGVVATAFPRYHPYEGKSKAYPDPRVRTNIEPLSSGNDVGSVHYTFNQDATNPNFATSGPAVVSVQSSAQCKITLAYFTPDQHAQIESIDAIGTGDLFFPLPYGTLWESLTIIPFSTSVATVPTVKPWVDGGNNNGDANLWVQQANGYASPQEYEVTAADGNGDPAGKQPAYEMPIKWTDALVMQTTATTTANIYWSIKATDPVVAPSDEMKTIIGIEGNAGVKTINFSGAFNFEVVPTPDLLQVAELRPPPIPDWTPLAMYVANLQQYTITGLRLVYPRSDYLALMQFAFELGSFKQSAGLAAAAGHCGILSSFAGLINDAIAKSAQRKLERLYAMNRLTEKQERQVQKLEKQLRRQEAARKVIGNIGAIGNKITGGILAPEKKTAHCAPPEEELEAGLEFSISDEYSESAVDGSLHLDYAGLEAGTADRAWMTDEGPKTGTIQYFGIATDPGTPGFVGFVALTKSELIPNNYLPCPATYPQVYVSKNLKDMAQTRKRAGLVNLMSELGMLTQLSRSVESVYITVDAVDQLDYPLDGPSWCAALVANVFSGVVGYYEGAFELTYIKGMTNTFLMPVGYVAEKYVAMQDRQLPIFWYDTYKELHDKIPTAIFASKPTKGAITLLSCMLTSQLKTLGITSKMMPKKEKVVADPTDHMKAIDSWMLESCIPFIVDQYEQGDYLKRFQTYYLESKFRNSFLKQMAHKWIKAENKAGKPLSMGKGLDDEDMSDSYSPFFAKLSNKIDEELKNNKHIFEEEKPKKRLTGKSLLRLDVQDTVPAQDDVRRMVVARQPLKLFKATEL